MVTDTTAKAGPYTASAGQTDFSFQFPVLSSAHVAVYSGDGAVPMNPAQYTVHLTGSAGGYVSLNSPATSGAIVTILRDVPFNQGTDIQNNTAFLPEVIEDSLDKLTMEAQQLKEELSRAVKATPTDLNPNDLVSRIAGYEANARAAASTAGGYASGAEAASSGAVIAENSASAYAAIAVGASAGAVNARSTASNYMASAGGFAENASNYMTGAQTASSGAVVAENNASSAATGFYNFTGSALAALIGSANVDPLLRNPDAEGCASGLYYGCAVTPYSSGAETGYKWADIVGEHDQDSSAHSVLFGGKISLPDSNVSSGCVFTANGSGSGAWLPQQGGGGGGAVQSVNGKVGAVVLSAGDVGALSVSGGTVTGNIQAENVNVTSGVNAGGVTGSTGAFNHLFLNDGADVTGDISVQGGVVTRGLKRKALSTLSAIPPENVVYTYTLTAAATVSFGTPTAGYCPTFELWLTMPATAVAVTFPDDVLWDDGSGEFSATNPAPDLSAGSKVYHLVFRHDGTAWLGNIAYTKAVA